MSGLFSFDDDDHPALRQRTMSDECHYEDSDTTTDDEFTEEALAKSYSHQCELDNTVYEVLLDEDFAASNAQEILGSRKVTKDDFEQLKVIGRGA